MYTNNNNNNNKKPSSPSMAVVKRQSRVLSVASHAEQLLSDFSALSIKDQEAALKKHCGSDSHTNTGSGGTATGRGSDDEENRDPSTATFNYTILVNVDNRKTNVNVDNRTTNNTVINFGSGMPLAAATAVAAAGLGLGPSLSAPSFRSDADLIVAEDSPPQEVLGVDVQEDTTSGNDEDDRDDDETRSPKFKPNRAMQDARASTLLWWAGLNPRPSHAPQGERSRIPVLDTMSPRQVFLTDKKNAKIWFLNGCS